MPAVVRGLITSCVAICARTSKPFRASKSLIRSVNHRNIPGNKCRTLSSMAEFLKVTADRNDPPYGKFFVLYLGGD